MQTLIFHPDVKDDIKASYQWYQGQAAGLGDDFLTELQVSYQAIIEFPDFWPSFQTGFKRYLLSRFPYSIIYRNTAQQIVVIAVMHNRRKPGYWQTRTSA